MSKPDTTPAREAAEKIVRIFGQFVSMHVNDILPDIEEACDKAVEEAVRQHEMSGNR